jgi:chemotaxis protein methyltransferase CheR
LIAVNDAELERFRAAIALRFGLRFEDARKDNLADVLRQRLHARGAARADAYLHRVETGWDDEDEALAERLTVGETYFFRYRDHFRAFSETVIPETEGRGTRRLSVLSAGCSSGEEPYSLAIAIREALPDFASRAVSIVGVDLNPAALAKAARGRYPEWSLRETPDALKARYFVREGREFALEAPVASMVAFERVNLSEDNPALFRSGAFDVVFCRNVTMYLAPEVTQRLVAQFARALAPGGFLFLGHAETLRGVSRDFVLCRSHDAFYYRRRDGASEGECVVFDSPPRARVAEASPLPTDVSWVDAIRHASDRIAALDRTAGDSRSRAPEPTPPAANGASHRAAVELFARERFGDAMAMLGAASGAERADPESRLLAAVLLANDGKLAEAERVCRTLLEDDDLNAGAHYVMALCREHAGDREGALAEDRMAAYLDPDFAMPHLHRGLLSRRAANLAEARGALEHAMALLLREADARILLFGGGFSRDALIALCRAELRACGVGA